jgi:hypothetical protein
MRTTTLMLFGTLTVATAGCADAAGEPPQLDSSGPQAAHTVTMEDVRKNGLPQVAKTSSALIAPTCGADQLRAAQLGQDILLRALVDGINAYAANTNNEYAMEVFGARNEAQTLTVFYNLLWAYQTLASDGQGFDIEYSCNSSFLCGPEDIACAPSPHLVVVNHPDQAYFWQAVPYIVAHEMFHWLGWGDPEWGTCGGDCPDDVHLYAQNDVAIAIEMPEAYALYLYPFIKPLFTQPIYN